jgi:hypothetical protein
MRGKGKEQNPPFPPHHVYQEDNLEGLKFSNKIFEKNILIKYFKKLFS